MLKYRATLLHMTHYDPGSRSNRKHLVEGISRTGEMMQG